MRTFNNGRPYHGSHEVTEGNLRGATGETDYFYFFCPRCSDNQILRILEYGIHAEQPENPYNKECKSKAKYGFVLVFKLYCENCTHADFVKISSIAWQGGRHSEILRR